MGKKRSVLGDVSHSALTGFARSDLLPAKKDPACVYWAESANGLEERCFSASAFAYEYAVLALGNLEIEVVQGELSLLQA